MWRLKYVYKHQDCAYSPLTKKYDIVFNGYPLNNYVKGKYIIISLLHLLEGKTKGIKKYVSHIQKFSQSVEIITPNMFLTKTKVLKNKKYYSLMYNPLIFYATPIIHKNGIEYFDILSWEKEPLQKILSFIQKSSNTVFVKLLSFRKEKPKQIFLVKTVQDLSSRQREVFELAKMLGYYNYPRKVDLKTLAKIMKISKSTLHEILRRAEAHVIGSIPT